MNKTAHYEREEVYDTIPYGVAHTEQLVHSSCQLASSLMTLFF